MSESSLEKAYATQIANIEKSTGKKLNEWIAIVNKSGFAKHGELVNFLKEKHGFTHGKENLKPWYDKIMNEISKFGKDIEVSPKKAYVSLRRKKQFAILQPSTKDRFDVGLNIKGVPPSGNVIAAGSWNAMCTHRIKIEDEKMIDKDLVNWIKQSYDQAG